MAIRSGNRMIAEGAIAAGCRFFSGYPITPASEIYELMTERLTQRGDIAIGAPDEITALCYAVGVSQRGFKVMTATSGPGFCLMTETIQYAAITESPVVIALVQRLGPSTGGATQGAQGDILLAGFVGSGYVIPVFYPSNPIECYEVTVHAFNWAERLRTPVILLSDKEVAMTFESIDLSELKTIQPVDRKLFEPTNTPGQCGFVPYFFQNPEEVPDFSPVGGKYKVTITGSAHNKFGQLRKNDPETLELLAHLQKKIESRAMELTMVKSDIEPGAETLIISFGITARAALEAMGMARSRGQKVSLLQLLTLFPIPERKIASSLNNTKRVVVAEENLTGVYLSLIKHLLAGREIIGVNKIGRMITPAEILSAAGGPSE
ncbi:MAG: pyruvate flavodoxin/ferredoxin oxidoreductase [Deltaproteobacteria bacterium]|nr:pyruvate flavodoxin/ferredoxin oxidoreductase [Deltaproteobacteria bacterium]